MEKRIVYKAPEVSRVQKSPELLNTPVDFYRDLAANIVKAKRSIDLEFFTFEKDNITKPIFEALHDVFHHNPDITVRIFLDHRGISPISSTRTRLALREIALDAQGRLLVQGSKNIFHQGGVSNLTSSLHKKIAVIDAETSDGVAYIGGMNISGRHANFADLMVKLHQPHIVSFIQRDFQRTWDHKSGKASKEIIDPYTIMHSVEKGGGTQFVEDLLDRINRTDNRGRILLETSYLDKKEVRQALIAAKQRGVDVQIIIPVPESSNDIRYRLMPKITTAPLQKADIPVFLFHGIDSNVPQFNHTKILIINETAFIGSYNFTTDRFSGGNNEELVLETSDPQFVKVLEKRLAEDKAKSQAYRNIRDNQNLLARRFLW